VRTCNPKKKKTVGTRNYWKSICLFWRDNWKSILVFSLTFYLFLKKILFFIFF